MGCYIKKYEELRKALKFSDQFAIVKDGFSSFFPAPPFLVNKELLDLLGLEIAKAVDVDEFNETYVSRESCFSMGVIDHMNIQSLRLYSPCIPKTYDLLQEAIEPLTKGSYYIVRDEDVEKFDLHISRFSTPVTDELGLAFVCKHHFDAKFKNPVKWEKCQIFCDGKPLEEIIDLQYKYDQKDPSNSTSIGTISIDIDATGIKRCFKDLAAAASKIAINTKAYGCSVTDLGTLYGTVSVPSYGIVSSTGGGNVDKSKTNDKLNGTRVISASYIEEVTNEVFKKTKLFKRLDGIRSSYLGKLDGGLNRVAMRYEIEDIFNEIEQTGDVNLIAGELRECESCSPVIVNIGSVNIDYKEEPISALEQRVMDGLAKAMKSLEDINNSK